MTRRAADELVERVVISGDKTKGFLGLVNQPTVPQTAVPNGAASSPLWSNKTPAEILNDVNTALMSAWSATSQVELHDTVLLPVAQFGLLAATPRSTTSDTTIMGYLQANNIYTSTTGRPLTIRTLSISGGGVFHRGRTSTLQLVLGAADAALYAAKRAGRGCFRWHAEDASAEGGSDGDSLRAIARRMRESGQPRPQDEGRERVTG